MRLVKYLVVLFSLSLFSCVDAELRGSVKPSDDELTYLVVLDNNGGQCGPIFVNGKEWLYEIGEAGEVSPGIVEIECGGKLTFEIQKGMTFYFDYWGP